MKMYYRGENKVAEAEAAEAPAKEEGSLQTKHQHPPLLTVCHQPLQPQLRVSGEVTDLFLVILHEFEPAIDLSRVILTEFEPVIDPLREKAHDRDSTLHRHHPNHRRREKVQIT